MKRLSYGRFGLVLATTSLLALGCAETETGGGRADTVARAPANGGATSGSTTGAAPTSQPAPASQPATADMRIEVDLGGRQLKVFEGGRQVATHPVAVGSERWPTEKGEWTIKQVVWNPDWVPPDESWAEERQRRESGDPKNPLGRAQLVYDLPRTIHGTNQPSSIGKAVSHGSIRMSNETIVQLARQVMEAGGAGKDEAWYRQAQRNRRKKQVIDLPRPVPIRVY